MAEKATPVSRKRKSVYDRAVKRKKAEADRAKTRVNIGVAFPRWRELKNQKGLHSDAMVALFLLDSYEKGTGVAGPPPTSVSTVLSLSDSVSRTFTSACVQGRSPQQHLQVKEEEGELHMDQDVKKVILKEEYICEDDSKLFPELPPDHLFKEEKEVMLNERNSVLNQGDSTSLEVKEEQQELFIGLEGEMPVLKQEAGDVNDDQTLHPGGAAGEPRLKLPGIISVVSESKSELQPFPKPVMSKLYCGADTVKKTFRCDAGEEDVKNPSMFKKTQRNAHR